MARKHGPKTPAAVKRTVARQRAVQRQVRRAERAHPRKEAKRAMQAGARRYPEPLLPRQHERKPGAEAAIEPAPMYEAPFYLGSSKLAGKVALITGADSGIGRAVAVLFAREGADIAIQYLCEHQDAQAPRRREKHDEVNVTLCIVRVSEKRGQLNRENSKYVCNGDEHPHGDVRAAALLGAIAMPKAYARFREAAEGLTGEEANIDFALAALAAAYDLPAAAPIEIFALARSVGWLAHMLEQAQTGALIRPRARYVGPRPGET